MSDINKDALSDFRSRCVWEDEQDALDPAHFDSNLHVPSEDGPEFGGTVCTDGSRTRVVWDWGQKQNVADSHEDGKRFLERVAYTDEIAHKAKNDAWEATA